MTFALSIKNLTTFTYNKTRFLSFYLVWSRNWKYIILHYLFNSKSHIHPKTQPQNWVSYLQWTHLLQVYHYVYSLWFQLNLMHWSFVVECLKGFSQSNYCSTSSNDLKMSNMTCLREFDQKVGSYRNQLIPMIS